jgi:hypothetical protein
MYGIILHGVALRMTKKMLAIAAEYEETKVEPSSGQLVCEPMRRKKPKPLQSAKNYRKRGPRR